MKLLLKEEKILRDVILPDLEKGRKDWDLEHTRAVVYWMKRLVKGSGLNEKVLVAAAYAHDWGYVGLVSGRGARKSVYEAKAKHMVIGANKIKNLLKTKLSESFTNEEIERVAHLVRVHDDFDKIEAEDEVMMVEADTLGILDMEKVQPSYTKDENVLTMKEIREKRRPLFKHKLAISEYPRLYKLREDFYEAK